MIEGYLARLGLRDRPAPSLETLRRLHRRHLDAVPYDNLAIMLGRPDPVDPADTLARLAAGGNAGYCFHHNGAFGLVLDTLGFELRRHPASMLEEIGDSGSLAHLALSVAGLATEDNPGGFWWPDLGYGDGFRDPLPLRVGAFRQGGFSYRITRIAGRPIDGWVFRNDPRASSLGSRIGPAGLTEAQVVAADSRLAGPGGRFTRLLVVQRREAAGAETLRGIRYTRLGARPFARMLRDFESWKDALLHLGVSLADVPDAELRGLHDQMRREPAPGT